MGHTPFAIGDLSFISGLPIGWPLRHGLVDDRGFTLVAASPCELDARMAAGTLDAAPISTVEFLKHRDRYAVIPDLGLSSWGRMGSAELFSRVPFSQLDGKPVALPPGGATMNMIARWLLSKMFGVRPVFSATEASVDDALAEYPAVLAIGDAALVASRRGPTEHQLDLGEAWWQLMQAPLVHTLWVCQASLPETSRSRLAQLFTEAKAQGQAHMAQIVAIAASRTGLPEADVEAYYALLNYDLTPAHEQALALIAGWVDERRSERD